MKFRLRVSGVPEVAASGVAGFGGPFSKRAEAAPLGWVVIDNRPCAVRLGGPCRVNNHRPDRRNSFVVARPLT